MMTRSLIRRLHALHTPIYEHTQTHTPGSGIPEIFQTPRRSFDLHLGQDRLGCDSAGWRVGEGLRGWDAFAKQKKKSGEADQREGTHQRKLLRASRRDRAQLCLPIGARGRETPTAPSHLVQPLLIRCTHRASYTYVILRERICRQSVNPRERERGGRGLEVAASREKRKAPTHT